MVEGAPERHQSEIPHLTTGNREDAIGAHRRKPSQLSLVRQRHISTRAEDLELMALIPSVFEDPLLRLQEDEGLAAATGLSGEPGF